MNPYSRTSLLRRTSGFTLIELLTVIAIIGILAAIIIPVTGKVRQNARRAAAASDLREVGTSLQLYCQENKDILPGPFWSHGNYAGYVYDNSPSSQIGRNLCAYLQPYLSTPVSRNGTWVESFAFKPAAFASLSTTASRANQFAYQVNHNHDATIDPDPAVRPFGGNRWTLSRIPNPSRTWFIKDLDEQNRPPNNPPGGSFMAPTPFHVGVRNVLHFDGHVKSVPISEQ
jgi:prepilin-type N-terminal cleavage/methylation domain-containing protein